MGAEPYYSAEKMVVFYKKIVSSGTFHINVTIIMIIPRRVIRRMANQCCNQIRGIRSRESDPGEETYSLLNFNTWNSPQ